jgi:hypothetical protein
LGYADLIAEIDCFSLDGAGAPDIKLNQADEAAGERRKERKKVDNRGGGHHRQFQ